jgi:fatty-acyl-CoA synthase
MRSVDAGVGSWIERRARTAPDDVALIHGDRTVTYAEMANRIRRLSNGLAGLGVGRGDRVGWLGTNHPAFLEALFAAASLGAALAPANHRLEPEQIRGVLEDIEPAVLIAHGPVDPDATPPSVRHLIAVGGGDDSWQAMEEFISGASDAPVAAAVDMDDVCFLAHTSGTTGAPKGVMLTHANVTWNVVNFLSCSDFRPGDVTIAVAPFFRVGGTGVNVLPVLFLGGTVVVPVEATADETLRLIARHRVTVGFGNPDSLEALTASPAWPGADLSSVRFIVTGGAPVSERLIRAFLDRGVMLQQGYGLSEAGPLALLLDPRDALSRIGSAGKPPLLVETRIERPDGTEAAAGETGELLVRGPNVMTGYWRRPDATEAVLSADGWLRTGDAARADEDGFVWIVDRVSAGFLSGGTLVYPGDIERALLRMQAIADVGAVCLESGPRIGIVAVVVVAAGATLTESDVLAFGRNALDPSHAPTSVRFVDRLPRNSVGKLARAELLDLASS